MITSTMPESNSIENDFIVRITSLVEENISNEHFGVSELASEIGMSRSNLLRKIKKGTNLSASQFIRQIRLQKAMELLNQSDLTVSEIAYKVGFSSLSYFIKCFGDQYGYSPGEVGKNEITETDSKNEAEPKKKKLIIFVGILFSIVVIVFIVFILFIPQSSKSLKHGKSIAVLPFINDSDDSTNVHIINGLMESTLNNLQQIEDLRVISRTSVEKYRNNLITTPEIANELNVSYLVEGSGQKIGDQILLTIQLIETATDNHLWSKQYERNTKDIFKLQIEVSKNIAEQIEAIITPAEEERIEKAPTTNLVAYDYFLQGLDLLNNPVSENVENSIPFFLEAIQHDNKFARAYAAMAIAYYVMDEGKVNKQYSDSINYYADKALLLDSKLPQSLTAKALFYMSRNEFELAVPYFEKALELSPNNDVVLIFLVDLYVNHLPNAAKYLEYALTGLKIDLVAAYDSTTASFSYLHISNAFIQSGFIEEAEKHINKSLDLFSGNLFSAYLKAFILYAKNEDLEKLKESLLVTYKKDSTRLDVMQEVGKTYYYLEDYKTSYFYYQKFTAIREAYKLDMYNSENYKIAYVFDKVGEKEKGAKYLEDFKLLAENTQSIYKHYNLALYYSCKGEAEKAIEHLQLFSEEENYHYWVVLFTSLEPMFKNIKDLPEYKIVFSKIEDKFNKYHQQVEASLKEEGLL